MPKTKWLDKHKLASDFLAGTFLNLASATSVEIAADAGFDWLLLDFEHGSGGSSQLRELLHACRFSDVTPIVRIPSLDRDWVKFVMDSGAGGIMFPFVSSVTEAEQAVSYLKYPPVGTRGVAGAIRATNYGKDWAEYFGEANDQSLAIVQIETRHAVEEAAEIAAVPGVDVLFVGPLDLSVSLGCPGDYSQPEFIEALEKVIEACKIHGKTPGILSKDPHLEQHKDMGFRFMAYGSDTGAIVAQMQQYVQSLRGN